MRKIGRASWAFAMALACYAALAADDPVRQVNASGGTGSDGRASLKYAAIGGDPVSSPEAAKTKAGWRALTDGELDDFAVDGSALRLQVERACGSGTRYRMYLLWPSAQDIPELRTSVESIRSTDMMAAVVLFAPRGCSKAESRDLEAFCAEESVSFLARPPEGLTAQAEADFAKFILDRNWGIDRDRIDRARNERAAVRTKRLHDAKWGVFNHYLGHGVRTAEEWNARVNTFDVKRLADQLEACGARYYFLTLMQGRRWMCAPNATFDRIAGTKPGEACSQRDLPAEVAVELEKRGIDFYLYFTGDGPWLDDELGPKFGYVEPRFAGVKRPFVEKWAAVMSEFAVRYGARVCGWWVDGCYRQEFHYTDELLELYAEAAHKGNPDALVACNDGVKPHYARHAESDEFTCGEFNDFFAVPPERFVDGAQTHALIPIAAWGAKRSPAWGGHGLKRSAEYIADYVSLVTANGGVVTIDVHVNADGSWDDEQLAALKVVGRRTGTLLDLVHH